MRLWARFVPQIKIFGLSLNPGPFTIKEHVIITIMANVGSGSAYAVCLQESDSKTMLTSSLDGHYRRPTGVLQPKPVVRILMAFSDVDTVGQ